MLFRVHQPRHQRQRPPSFNILAPSPAALWHVREVQPVCVCAVLALSVCDFVRDPFGSQSSHSLTLLLLCVRVAAKPAFCFIALRGPL